MYWLHLDMYWLLPLLSHTNFSKLLKMSHQCIYENLFKHVVYNCTVALMILQLLSVGLFVVIFLFIACSFSSDGGDGDADVAMSSKQPNPPAAATFKKVVLIDSTWNQVHSIKTDERLQGDDFNTRGSLCHGGCRRELICCCNLLSLINQFQPGAWRVLLEIKSKTGFIYLQ